MAYTIGFLGAGRLGEPMVGRLLAAGHDVLVCVRREDARRRLVASGALAAESVADLAGRSDVLISCLFSDDQLRDTGLGRGGFVANAKPGSIVVSHTTGTVSTLEALRVSAASPPVILDAPVSGTADDVTAGALTVLVGGPGDAVDAVTPILAAYADPIIPTGPVGSALVLKLINNLLFAANVQSLLAATQLGTQSGVSPAILLAALQVCSGTSHAVDYAVRVGGVHRFEELLTPYLRKDVAACREATARQGVPLGVLDGIIRDGPLQL